MQTNDITCRKQFIKCHFLVFLRQTFLWLAGIHPNFHPQSFSYLRSSLTCISKTNNPDFLSGQFYQWCIPVTKIGLCTPYSIMHFMCIMSYSLCNIQQMRNSHLGNRLCTICRNIGNNDSTLASHIQINNIISCCQNSYILQLWQ